MTNSCAKSPLDRFMNLFTEVQAGEGLNSLLLAFNIFIIMTSYYIMKPVREALIIGGAGAVIKSYASTGQVILLLIAVPLYARIASRYPRRQLINTVTIFFVFCIVLFYVLALFNVPLGVIFFLWIGIFNLMITAQFWAFANDLYTPEEGKRLFVIIAFGALLGAVLGGIIARVLIEPIGPYQLLLVAGAILFASLILTNYVDARERTRLIKRSTEQSKKVEEPFQKGGAFKLVFKTRYLLLIAFLILVLNWVNTNGEFILGLNVQHAAEQEIEKLKSQNSNRKNDSENIVGNDQLKNNHEGKSNVSPNEEYYQEYKEKFVGKFYADFYTYVNITGLLLQLFIVSRILKYLGFRIALLILPLIALGGYFFIVFYPILSFIRTTKVAENSTDYSLQNTVRHGLFLPTTREQKYKAKQAIDTFFWRAGDVLSTALVAVGTTWLAFHTKQFALVNLGLVCIWLILAVFIGRENKRLVGEYSENNNQE
jgi:AAA family ATP:ADP antiporter